MFTKDEKELLKKAGIEIPKNTPFYKKEIIQIGIELCELDKNDIELILNEKTTEFQASQILTTNRQKGQPKHL